MGYYAKSQMPSPGEALSTPVLIAIGTGFGNDSNNHSAISHLMPQVHDQANCHFRNVF